MLDWSIGKQIREHISMVGLSDRENDWCDSSLTSDSCYVVLRQTAVTVRLLSPENNHVGRSVTSLTREATQKQRPDGPTLPDLNQSWHI